MVGKELNDCYASIKINFLKYCGIPDFSLPWGDRFVVPFVRPLIGRWQSKNCWRQFYWCQTMFFSYKTYFIIQRRKCCKVSTNITPSRTFVITRCVKAKSLLNWRKDTQTLFSLYKILWASYIARHNKEVTWAKHIILSSYRSFYQGVYLKNDCVH